MSRVNNRKGFTLVEVIVILVVLAILAGLAIPVALKIFEKTAENTTNTEMQNLKNAIVGDTSKLASNRRSDFGYLGDVGCLPGSLQALLTKPSGVPDYSFDSATQIGAGWRGPYITGSATGQETDTFTKDEWGNSYTYTPAGTPACPPNATTTFISNGPDAAVSTSDDINYSVASSDTTSTVSGFLKDPNGGPVRSSQVRINFPQQGSVTFLTGTTDTTGFFTVSNIPFGNRSLTFPAGSPKLIATSVRATTAAFGDTGGNIICAGGVARNNAAPCQYLEFTLVNFSTSAVTVTSVTATYTTTPVSYYYRINWGGTNVLDCDDTCTVPAGGTPVPGSGTTKTITSSTAAAASSSLRPIKFVVDSSQLQLGDLRIGAAGEVGSTVRVRLVNFRDDNTRSDKGNPVSVNGVPFTITFSDGSVLQFTPTNTP